MFKFYVVVFFHAIQCLACFYLASVIKNGVLLMISAFLFLSFLCVLTFNPSIWCILCGFQPVLVTLYCVSGFGFGFFLSFLYVQFISLSGFDALGDLLKPTIPTHTEPPPPPPQMAIHPGGKLLANDLDSSLANLVGSECQPFGCNM